MNYFYLVIAIFFGLTVIVFLSCLRLKMKKLHFFIYVLLFPYFLLELLLLNYCGI